MYKYALFVGGKSSQGPDRDFIRGFRDTDEAVEYYKKHEDLLIGKKKTYSLTKEHELYCCGESGTIKWFKLMRIYDWHVVKESGAVDVSPQKCKKCVPTAH